MTAKNRIVLICAICLMAAVVILDVITVIPTTERLLDSDSSSEMVLAKHLHDTGQILSKDWYYSTELRVLNTQLVFAPLFSLTDNWHTVRAAGTLILQALLLLSFWYMCKAADQGWITRLIGGAMLLLPTSVAYGRIVLYQTFYIPHVALSFLITALFINAVKQLDKTKGERGRLILYMILLAVVSFVSGMGGMRQMAVTILPLWVVNCVGWIGRRKSETPEKWGGIGSFGVLAAASIAFLGGLVINYLLGKEYHFLDSSFGVGLYEGRLNLIGYSMLHFFGFRTGANGEWLPGVSPLTIGICAILWIHLIRKEWKPLSGERVILWMFPACMLVACGAVFFSSKTRSVRHILMFAMWFIPFFPILLHNRQKYVRILSAVCVVCFLGNGVLNTWFFRDPNSFPQRYDGNAGCMDTEVTVKMEPLVQKLMDESYDMGYATYWECNVVTEMSNGKIPMIGIVVQEDGSVSSDVWLTLASYRKVTPEKPFAIISGDLCDAFEKSEAGAKCTLIWDDPAGSFRAYAVNDPAEVRTIFHIDDTADGTGANP